MKPPPPVTVPPAAAPQLVTRASIRALLKAPPPKPRQASILAPALGGLVHVRGLKGSERDDWEVSIFHLLEVEEARLAATPGTPRDTHVLSRNLRARLVAFTACDQDGQRLFDLEDVPWLSELPAEDLDPVYALAESLSGLEPKDVEKLVGESAGDRSSAPGSDSPRS